MFNYIHATKSWWNIVVLLEKEAVQPASNKNNQNRMESSTGSSFSSLRQSWKVSTESTVSNFQLLWLPEPNFDRVTFTAFIRVYLSLSFHTGHWPIVFFIFNLSLVRLFTPLHRSLPGPSERACWGELLSQNKHITPDSISLGQLLRTDFLLIDLHPSLSFLSLLPPFSSIFSLSES